MPTYQYACTECGGQLEVVQRFSDDPLTMCSGCGGRLRKVFSPVGIVFKGSGFYRTDSRAGSVSGANGNGKSGSDGSGAGEGGGSKSESGAKSESGSSSGAKSGTEGSGKSGSDGSGGGSSKTGTAAGAGSKVA